MNSVVVTLQGSSNEATSKQSDTLPLEDDVFEDFGMGQMPMTVFIDPH